MDLSTLQRGRNVSSMRGNLLSDCRTAMLLSIYEVLQCSSKSWTSLVTGASELMRRRGPDAYLTWFKSTLFRALEE
ncbi:hypothetical protein V1517DRAFT_37499 [Lipomyces orientalis]|uniref:Uncharacterized protein n=1 Tax=Lipomyces orientalis TaxID=1233043 RepID=A0ACC3TFE2_9ASCO